MVDVSISDQVPLNSARLNHLVYAGDLVLLSESKEGLQSCLDSLPMYCDRWQLKINVETRGPMVLNRSPEC